MGLQGVAQALGQRTAVGKGIVARRLHGFEVGLTFLGVEGSGRQLSIWKSNIPFLGMPFVAIPPVALLHDLDMVRTDLMAEAPRPRVNHRRHLSGTQPKGLCGFNVQDFVDDLEFEEMVP